MSTSRYGLLLSVVIGLWQMALAIKGITDEQVMQAVRGLEHGKDRSPARAAREAAIHDVHNADVPDVLARHNARPSCTPQLPMRRWCIWGWCGIHSRTVCSPREAGPGKRPAVRGQVSKRSV
jgi:hypothetical protein